MRPSESNIWWRLAVPIVTQMIRLLFRVRVEGIDRIPARGPAILMFNHVSVLDGPCVAGMVAGRTRREIRFLVAAEVFDHPVWGLVMRGYHQIPVRRGTGDAAALDQAVSAVRDGAVAALAPEGRIADHPANGELQRIHSGVARIALPSGAPMLPVGIWGTNHRWPRDQIIWSDLWRRPLLGISIGEPVQARGDVSHPADIEATISGVREALATQVTRARLLAGDPAQTGG
ncbi:MAG: lysophospholipid acyltransferase family protein [Actinomycetota bacterium]